MTDKENDAETNSGQVRSKGGIRGYKAEGRAAQTKPELVGTKAAPGTSRQETLDPLQGSTQVAMLQSQTKHGLTS